MWEVPVVSAIGVPYPSLSRFLVFMKIAGILAQNHERVRLTGKFLLTKELFGIL